MTEANRGALLQVVSKIAPQAAMDKISTLSDAEILNFIKEVSIISEKVSDIRYLAELDVTINDKILKAYLDEKNISSINNITTSNVLIIPTFREFETEAPLLWEDENIWRQAWEANSETTELVNFISIPLTGANYASIDAKKALELNGVAFDKLLRLNGADDIYLVDAYYDGIEGLIVKIHSYGSGTNAFETIKISGDRSVPSELFHKATQTIKNTINEKQKDRIIKEDSTENHTVAMYSYKNLKDLIYVENKLKNIPQIKNVIIDASSNNQAQFKITYTGSSEKLLQSLESKSLHTIVKDSFIIISKNSGVQNVKK